ncbi:MAG: phosphoribosylglycinamide formyltransferase [Elusimicrobiaceae bacterium]|jgi:phosphoribosylglycinamide formyltransferase 1|nr:phosphoribosylglycinamide formyltransferase [Elusimicrobiaceae bacterium]MBT3955114.1 phosphoribosylglycinamide formyltransferase [Elusimicrobiaceae bacterium]MBT4008021.1 phosphoribosylglycinamide formyltransferase [Elusimicrobiaceae bacterium]MBT4403203.1 phosphoribosylglycinamide formyltransferase [Elusimicrobiaceae bacterium]MBT4440358.1 phosphoribosylglycinamide formyltransferase [Elusimicrobiaceae bacterium]
MKKIVVFASGTGTNFKVLLDACKSGEINGEIILLITNKQDIGALKIAEEGGIESKIISPKTDNYENILYEILKEIKPDLICLAGYLLKIPQQILEICPIMNIHPALLPNYGGKGMYGAKVHQAVLDSGDKTTGVTVHFIDEEYDKGKIILQEKIEIAKGETVESLTAKIQQVEHKIYPKAVKLFCNKKAEI